MSAKHCIRVDEFSTHKSAFLLSLSVFECPTPLCFVFSSLFVRSLESVCLSFIAPRKREQQIYRQFCLSIYSREQQQSSLLNEKKEQNEKQRQPKIYWRKAQRTRCISSCISSFKILSYCVADHTWDWESPIRKDNARIQNSLNITYFSNFCFWFSFLSLALSSHPSLRSARHVPLSQF